MIGSHIRWGLFKTVPQNRATHRRFVGSLKF